MDGRIIHGSCTDVLASLPAGSARLIFADPPFNIGLKYDVYGDRKGYSQYVAWLDTWISACHRVLAPDGSMYVMIGDEYQAEVNLAMKKAGFVWRNTLVWHYSFGQSQRKKFARSHCLIHYFVRDPERFVWNLDDVRVPSARALKYGDKRAHPLGKAPDDVFAEDRYLLSLAEVRAAKAFLDSFDHVEEGASGSELLCETEVPSDVWKISRLCGTFKERLKQPDGSVHPCQLPESLLERIIKVSSSPGDLVLDPFAGTGTTAAVAAKLGRPFVTMDLSENYCSVVAGRVFGDPGRYERASAGE